MTLIQLRYFCAACEENSITKAAEDFFVSQPAVSAAIRELEKEYGVQLLERKYKGFTLTENGQFFYKKASQLLQEADLFSQEIHALALKDRYVALGLTRSVGSSTYARFFPWFVQEEQGGIELHTVPGSSAELYRMLLKGKLDALILPTEAFEATDELKSQTICHTSMVFAISEKHHLSGEPFATVPMICDENMVGTVNDTLRTKRLTEIFAEYGKTPKIIKRYDQLSTVLHAVQSNVAIALVPIDLIPHYKGVVPLSLKELPEISVSLAWSKESYRKPGVRRFVKDMIHFFEEEMTNR